MAKYEIPVIPHNLRKEETVVQIAEVLNHLSSVSENIFKRINERVSKNNELISSINERIDKAKQKLNDISGVKRAIKVFSSCKYPAEGVNRQYISVFNQLDNISLKKVAYKYKNSQTKDEPIENLQLYHVESNKGKIIKNDCKGLGEVPDDLAFINNLLLFNSGINPYNNYILSDTLNVTQNIKKEGFNNTSQIVAAPISISDKSGMPKSIEPAYFYAPDLGNVPTINVPLDLPDLPGIADDLRYVDDKGPGIAPSVITPNVPDLPLIEEKEVFPIINDLTILPQVTHDVDIPEEPPQLEINSPVEIIKEEVKDMNIVHPEKVVKAVEVIAPKTSFDVTDTRANLMEEIRKVGGTKKLRTTIDKDSSKAAPPQGDLMADLHLKLAMRRKGISGSKSSENNFDSKTAMEKISAMIPPPSAQLDTSETTEDEGWEEE